MKYLLFGALVTFATLSLGQLTDDAFAEGNAYNEDVSRKINLGAEGVVEIATDITFKTGKGIGSEPYYYVIPADSYEGHLISISAFITNTQEEVAVKRVQVAEIKNTEAKAAIAEKNASDLVVFKLVVPTSENKAIVRVSVKELYKRRKEPFPHKISIREDMSLRFVDSKYYISVYPTKSQKVQINHSSPVVQFFTPDATVEKKQRFIKYGPFKNIEALSFSELMVHYRHSKPLPIFQDVKKTIEVSHWGNILVDEYYEIFNEAAGIKGEFGRVDYQQWDQNRAQYAIKSLQTSLPRYIRGLYYWDYIGNISSSNALRNDDQVSFRIEPRFPVMGQWKTDWSQGYNIPTRHHLFRNKDDGRYVFNYTFDHDFDSIVAENFTLKVILPEGATNIKVFFEP